MTNAVIKGRPVKVLSGPEAKAFMKGDYEIEIARGRVMETLADALKNRYVVVASNDRVVIMVADVSINLQ